MRTSDSNPFGKGLCAVLCALAGALVTPAVASTQIGPVTVMGMSIYNGSLSSQGAVIFITPAVPGAEGCSISAGNQVWIDFSSPTQPDGRSLYATVLAAYLAGHTLGFGVSGCAVNGMYPLVYRVDVGP